MSAMIMPKLWSANSKFSIQITLSQLQKYKHLLKWKKEESILEFGFADGKNSSATLGPLLPKDYKEFVATDISKEMVEYAKKHNNIPKSKILQLNITADVPSEFQNRFDHVFGFNVMHMVKHPRVAFKNIHKMLKPGGSTFLNFFELSPLDNIFDNLTRHPKWRKYGQETMISPYFYSENPKNEFQKDLEAAEFKNYILESEKVSYKFPSEKECDNLFTSANATIPMIPEDDYEEYIKDYLQQKEKSPQVSITYEKNEKTIALNCTSLVVIASKGY